MRASVAGLKPVLVTGATGLVGANLVRVLLERGTGPVRILARRTARLDVVEGLDVAVVRGDLLDEASLDAAFAGCGGVFHVAGLADPGVAEPGALDRVNVHGTDLVCRAAKRAGIERLVYTSSAAVIDAPAVPGEVADEDTPAGHGGRVSAYAMSKRRAEAVVRGHIDGGLPAVIVNPALMFGAWDVRPTSGRVIVGMARRWLPFYPTGGTNVIDVLDAALGHVLAFERGQVGRRYILGHRNLRFRELAAMVARVVGRRPPVLPLPPGPAKLALRLAAPALRLLPAALRDLARPENIDEASRLHFVSSARAIAELGLPQSPVEAAIERAYAWLRDHGHLER